MGNVSGFRNPRVQVGTCNFRVLSQAEKQVTAICEPSILGTLAAPRRVNYLLQNLQNCKRQKTSAYKTFAITKSYPNRSRRATISFQDNAHQKMKHVMPNPKTWSSPGTPFAKCAEHALCTTDTSKPILFTRCFEHFFVSFIITRWYTETVSRSSGDRRLTMLLARLGASTSRETPSFGAIHRRCDSIRTI